MTLDSRRRGWVALAALVLIALGLTALHVRAYPTISPIDETQHVDYLTKAGNLDIPRRNERIGQPTMREVACRGVDAPGFETPPCDLEEFDPEDFPERGFNTAANQHPTYYLLTGPIARATVALGLVDSIVTAGRLLGGLWLALGIVLTWAAMAELGVRRRHRVAPLLLAIATPLLLFHASTINSDAALFASGALVTWTTLRYAGGRTGPVVLGSAYVFAFLVEPSTVVMIAVSLTFLVLQVPLERGPREHAVEGGNVFTQWSGWRWVLPLAIVPVVVAIRLWIRNSQGEREIELGSSGDQAPMFTRVRTDGVDWGRVLGQLDATMTPVARAYLPPLYRTETTLAFIFMTNWLFIAALVGMSLVATGRRALLARVVTVALVLAGPFYTWYYAEFSQSDFPAPGRFALPVVAAMLVVAASAIRTRTAEIVAGTIAVASTIAITVQLL